MYFLHFIICSIAKRRCVHQGKHRRGRQSVPPRPTPTPGPSSCPLLAIGSAPNRRENNSFLRTGHILSLVLEAFFTFCLQCENKVDNPRTLGVFSASLFGLHFNSTISSNTQYLNVTQFYSPSFCFGFRNPRCRGNTKVIFYTTNIAVLPKFRLSCEYLHRPAHRRNCVNKDNEITDTGRLFSLLVQISCPGNTKDFRLMTNIAVVPKFRRVVSIPIVPPLGAPNYRHTANALSLYRTVKRLGLTDDRILLPTPPFPPARCFCSSGWLQIFLLPCYGFQVCFWLKQYLDFLCGVAISGGKGQHAIAVSIVKWSAS